jgi:regulator of cell morphogenesis and NO signaling
MARISTSTTVADLVADRPSRVELFEELGVDYVFGGTQELGEACADHGLDEHLVVTLLRVELAANDAPGPAWSHGSTAELCDHIVEMHHGYLHRELPHLSALWARVERTHGASDPMAYEIRRTFERLRVELVAHVEDEERTVFPFLCELDDGGRVDAALASAVLVLEHEHAVHGLLLARLRMLTDGYDASLALCDTHRWAIEGLGVLERDLRRHLHKENTLLFPRVPA